MSRELDAILEWQEQQVVAKQTAIRSLFTKGEGAGHEFRGNQWVQASVDAAQEARSLGRLLDKISADAGDLSPVIQRHLALAEKHLAIASGLKQTDEVASKNHEVASKAHRQAAQTLSEGRNYNDSHKAVSNSVMAVPSVRKNRVAKGMDESLADILRHDQDHDNWHAKHGDPPCKSEADCARMRAKYAEVKAEEAVSKGGEGSGIKGHTTDRPEPARQVDAGRNQVSAGRNQVSTGRRGSKEPMTPDNPRWQKQATKKTLGDLQKLLVLRPKDAVTDMFGVGTYHPIIPDKDAIEQTNIQIRGEVQGVIEQIRSGSTVKEVSENLGGRLESLQDYAKSHPDDKDLSLNVKIVEAVKQYLDNSYKVNNGHYDYNIFGKQATPIEKGGEGSGRYPAGSGDANLTPSGHRPIATIASEIVSDWKNPYFGAKPYLDAMFSLSDIKDNYGLDSARSIVSYFIANASQWKGEKARAIKAELKKIVNSK